MKSKLKKSVPLKDFTTYKIGGPARHYVLIEDSAELPEVINDLRLRREPYFVLGGGSNLLISDRGFPGTVIHMQNLGFELRDDHRLVVQAGEPLGNFVEFAIENGLEGVEWATSVPGTVGGAVVGNAGAFTGTMSDIVKKITVFNPSSHAFRTYLKPECDFAYRSSRFKHSGEVVTTIEFELRPAEKKELRIKSDQIRDYRASRHPQEPSVGSVFKNIDDMKFIKPFIEADHEAREHYVRRWKSKIPTAYLIELCGLKGYRIGGAQIAHKHSAFIINTGNAKAEDVAIMTGLIKERIWNRFKIHLKEEMRYVGF